MTTTKPTKTYPAARPKVPPFARFRGTSVWKQYKNKARAYARFRAAANAAIESAAPVQA